MQAALFFATARRRQSGRLRKAESWLSALRSETIDHCSAKKSISVLCGRTPAGARRRSERGVHAKSRTDFFDFDTEEGGGLYG